MGALPTGLLSLPQSGDRELAGIVREARKFALKTLLAISPAGLSPKCSHSLMALQHSIVTATRRAPTVVLDAIGSPDVLPPILALAGGMADPEVTLRHFGPSLIAALAHYRTRGVLEVWAKDLCRRCAQQVCARGVCKR